MSEYKGHVRRLGTRPGGRHGIASIARSGGLRRRRGMVLADHSSAVTEGASGRTQNVPDAAFSAGSRNGRDAAGKRAQNDTKNLRGDIEGSSVALVTPGRRCRPPLTLRPPTPVTQTRATLTLRPGVDASSTRVAVREPSLTRQGTTNRTLAQPGFYLPKGSLSASTCTLRNPPREAFPRERNLPPSSQRESPVQMLNHSMETIRRMKPLELTRDEKLALVKPVTDDPLSRDELVTTSGEPHLPNNPIVLTPDCKMCDEPRGWSCECGGDDK